VIDFVKGSRSAIVGQWAQVSASFRRDIHRSAGHLLDNAAAHCGKVDWAAAQDHDAFVTVWLRIHCENGLERLAIMR